MQEKARTRHLKMLNGPVGFAENTRSTLLKLPRVTETVQWGGLLVYWVLDRAVGGKIFAILNPEATEDVVLSFAAGPARAPELLETDGVRPAPHLARAHWVSLVDWQVLSRAEITAELEAAHAYVSGRMPPRTQRLLELGAREYKALVREKSAAAKADAAKQTEKRPGQQARRAPAKAAPGGTVA